MEDSSAFNDGPNKCYENDTLAYRYLFQCLPIFLTRAFFKFLDSIILPFVWGFKALLNIKKLHKTNKITMLSTLLLGSKCKGPALLAGRL